MSCKSLQEVSAQQIPTQFGEQQIQIRYAHMCHEWTTNKGYNNIFAAVFIFLSVIEPEHAEVYKGSVAEMYQQFLLLFHPYCLVDRKRTHQHGMCIMCQEQIQQSDIESSVWNFPTFIDHTWWLIISLTKFILVSVSFPNQFSSEVSLLEFKTTPSMKDKGKRNFSLG